MNILKLKDKLKYTPEGKLDEYYNTHFKSKYVFWVHMKYLISFDDMDIIQYSKCEEDISNLEKYKHYDIYSDVDPCDWNEYIDFTETNRINDISLFEMANKYVTSKELTIDQIKKFRTWLATTLLTFDLDEEGNQKQVLYNDEITHLLEFYKNGMYDDVVKYLSLYIQVPSLASVLPGCSCCLDASMVQLQQANINICDNVGSYKLGIHNKMVETFSNIDFWFSMKPADIPFLTDFKLYIDNILVLNLPFGIILHSDFVDCGCLQGSIDGRYKNILNNLSQSLQYMIKGEINQHKLFILDSFKTWADLLYELMEW